MLGTQIDTVLWVSVFSWYFVNLRPANIKAAKRVICYLGRTSQIELAFWETSKPLTRYTNVDWAGDIPTQRSNSSFLFNIGSRAISWSSKQQPIVSFSTCKTEYIAQTQATKEALWLQLLLSPLLMDKQEPTTTIIFGDNQEVMALAKNPQFHARTKQIAIQNHFMKEQQTARTVKL